MPWTSRTFFTGLDTAKSLKMLTGSWFGKVLIEVCLVKMPLCFCFSLFPPSLSPFCLILSLSLSFSCLDPLIQHDTLLVRGNGKL